jgi:4-hydroxyphenylpyruvate dioxygenase
MLDLIAPLPKSIATVSLSGGLAEKLEAIAAVGFDGVEIFENDLLTFDGTPGDVRYLAESLGLTITCFQPFRDFEAMPESQRARNLDRAERKFDVMQALGTDLLLVCSNISPAAIGDDGQAAADLAELAERAHRRGLRIGFEALAWGRHISTWRHAWEVVSAANHPALGLILDSFHTLALGNFPGQGQLPVAAFVRDLIAAGYRGPLSLEIFNDEFRAAPARLMARDGLRALLLVEAEAGVTALPDVPHCDGIEFLEFAVDDESGRRLGETLRTLGFHYAGRHRSKSVDLFRQGGINLILNSEQDSAAAEHFHFHGPSVCAMAFRVDDAQRAVQRAEALLCPEWRERSGPGERQIPALRAPDGTLLYLVAPSADGSTIYDVDFRMFEEVAPAPLLASVDHVAQALPVGRMDNFVLFYRALLGLTPEPLWEIPDTMGLIRSRTMTSAGREIRLPLNISESRETATGRFLTTFSGAGVQHIALASPDIRHAVAQLESRGVRFLPIPGNYYEDIAAKWGLADAHVAMLRAHNILFDRDDAGDFLHAYTNPFDDRFFFEIVQRIGGYQQYGAANASVRVAAQSRRRAAPPDGDRLA